jgi:aryl-alcohol dehydrogenase-like predicted oxidoreductase
MARRRGKPLPSRQEAQMQYRSLGRTGWGVSTVSFGAWAIGGTWGAVEDEESLAALHRAVDLGVNFIDTADVYGDGHSERLVAQVCRERKERIYVTTKAGRRLDPHTAAGYKNLTPFIERSLRNLGTEAIDLLQLHCPPVDVYYMPEVFEGLDELVQVGKIRCYGVSVERVEEALKAIEYPGVQSVQIIYNALRQRPAELFLPEAKRRQVGVLARLPLSSGLLAGKMTRETAFDPTDHRNFNRQGEAFDRGETFSGIPFVIGLELVQQLRAAVPESLSMAQWALRWVLMNEAVTCAIPGAKRPAQVEENVAAADLPPLSDELMAKVAELYETSVKPLVHQYW